jgi:DNA-binding transcriptional regulator YiaG
MANTDAAFSKALLFRMIASGEARALRERAHLTQPDVASALGVGIVTVHHWETGKHLPQAAHAVAYGAFLLGLAQVADGDLGG